jgi:hypothetical protein
MSDRRRAAPTFACARLHAGLGMLAASRTWPRLARSVEKRAMAALCADLSSGAWEQQYGQLRRLPTYDGALRLVVSRTASGLI